jgi:hypothetical protein
MYMIKCPGPSLIVSVNTKSRFLFEDNTAKQVNSGQVYDLCVMTLYHQFQDTVCSSKHLCPLCTVEHDGRSYVQISLHAAYHPQFPQTKNFHFVIFLQGHPSVL